MKGARIGPHHHTAPSNHHLAGTRGRDETRKFRCLPHNSPPPKDQRQWLSDGAFFTPMYSALTPQRRVHGGDRQFGGAGAGAGYRHDVRGRDGGRPGGGAGRRPRFQRTEQPVPTTDAPNVDRSLLPNTFIGAFSAYGRDSELGAQGGITTGGMDIRGSLGSPVNVIVNMCPLPGIMECLATRHLYDVEFGVKIELPRRRKYLVHCAMESLAVTKFMYNGSKLLYTEVPISSEEVKTVEVPLTVMQETNNISVRLKHVRTQRATLEKETIQFFWLGAADLVCVPGRAFLCTGNGPPQKQRALFIVLKTTQCFAAYPEGAILAGVGARARVRKLLGTIFSHTCIEKKNAIRPKHPFT
eukprot:NODE_771_length_1462_cov_34.640481_g635_i0.p1 GENE.NODE_771_length_1462_cov_34.640481_g635_i0~~NODE_771_length_1462_cov_34.640481_g635_i0.p1  ORF type:complete len:356 (+),score=25.03 NODE_771_length_1462_cov_34.640481_g635_i0:55-1122(+)